MRPNKMGPSGSQTCMQCLGEGAKMEAPAKEGRKGAEAEDKCEVTEAKRRESLKDLKRT